MNHVLEDNKFGEKAVFKRPNQIAVSFQCVKDRGNKEALNVDFAPNPNNQPDWKQKGSIQLTIDELPLMIALFVKLVGKCNFAYHGANNNNSLVINRNTDNNNTQFYFELFIAGKQRGFVFLTQMEAFRVYKLTLRQLSSFYKQTEQEVIDSIKHFYD